MVFGALQPPNRFCCIYSLARYTRCVLVQSNCMMERKAALYRSIVAPSGCSSHVGHASRSQSYFPRSSHQIASAFHVPLLQALPSLPNTYNTRSNRALVPLPYATIITNHPFKPPSLQPIPHSPSPSPGTPSNPYHPSHSNQMFSLLPSILAHVLTPTLRKCSAPILRKLLSTS